MKILRSLLSKNTVIKLFYFIFNYDHQNNLMFLRFNYYNNLINVKEKTCFRI